MSKRGAENYLTDENWDNDDEPQEAGSFTRASETVMQNRQFRRAKRRAVGEDSGSSSEGSSAFKGFSGFGAVAKPSTPSFSFGGFGSATSASTTPSNGATTGGSATKSTDSVSPARAKLSNGTSKSPNNKAKYMSQLKTLNEGVVRWIKQHVDSNPYCILTPIFADYEKYLKEIEQKYPYKEERKMAVEEKDQEKADSSDGEEKSEEKPEEKEKDKEEKLALTFSSSGTGIFGSASTGSTAAAGFIFNSATASSSSSSLSSTSTTTTSSAFSFSKDSGGDTAPKPVFGFGGSSGGLGGAAGFSFAVAKPSSTVEKSSGDGKTEDEEYVPPKEEVKEVQEEDAYYTKRCKLFFKKDESWAEKGLGNLHLKDCDGKTQLLIRADTNLGNILLNIMITSSIPASRQGKNNVTIICIPNPPLSEKEGDDKTPVSMLIRVKTAEDADELFEKLQAAKSK